MDDETYVAVVEIHDQPPFETPAAKRTHTRTFAKDVAIRDIWGWANTLRRGDYNTITRLEIRPNE